MKPFKKRVTTRMVRLDNGSDTTYDDLLGTVEGLRNYTIDPEGEDDVGPMTIYNSGVAEWLERRGVVQHAEGNRYYCISEATRKLVEDEIRALVYRGVPHWPEI